VLAEDSGVVGDAGTGEEWLDRNALRCAGWNSRRLTREGELVVKRRRP